jgi:NAD(P)-dependent dehydrogenase (short-subunit alcohol dehydrogenase family)|tara:strand:+ start:2027 stop:2701 length:675 start_codon:yes stop_codon:yes gene_type:complete
MNHTVLVTGSSRGIGLELCKQLNERGDRVIATCRQSTDALAALDVEVLENVDVSDPKSLTLLSARLKERKIDWLINNAGVLQSFSLDDLGMSCIANFKKMFDVNSLGPLLVTKLLLKHLGSGSKVGLITSRMGSIADNDSGGSYGYRMSKAAANAAGKSLAIDLKSQGIAVGILHPGYVRTDMTGHIGLMDADESVIGLIERMDNLNLTNTGSFWHTNGDLLSW